MKTVLFAWELGEGLGHVSPLLAVADALVTAGRGRGLDIVPVFALCEPIFGRESVATRGWRVLPTPRMTEIGDIRTRGASYADLLAMFGFGRKRELSLAVAAWDDLFAVTAPDLVVADHSPTACLAARGRLPLVVSGSGYFAPPADLPAFPALNAEAPVTQNQAVLLETVNAVLADRGVARLRRLPQMLEGDGRAVLTLPHFDPYRALRAEPVLGYHQRIAGPLAPAPAERIFFYGRSNDPHVDDIAQVLGRCGLPVIAHIRGVRTAALSYLQQLGIDHHDRPLQPLEAFGKCSIVVSHGGGIAQTAAQAGRRQVILPTHLEPMITGARLEHYGAGIMVDRFEADAFADAIARVRADARFEEGALALARDIAATRLPEDPAAAAADICLQVLDRAAAA
jgi:hypothetical protein